MAQRHDDPSNYELHPKEVETMKSWISKCTKEHENCTPPTPAHSFPTRLLDLRTSILQLVDGKDLKPQDGGYAALSYCWGTTMPEEGKTTRLTIDARRVEIDINSLPRTFREAIYVTRALDIPFIWIDALCIIQGDYEDWKIESANMYHVYSYAVVTIAAASTDHCNGGFLLPRISNQYFRPLPPSSSIDACKSVQYSSLSKRGWSLQERHLSARIIHFSKSYIIWQCREHFYHYQTVSRKRPEITKLDINYLNANVRRCFDSGSPKMGLSKSDYKSMWYFMMEDYSRRVFTDPRDKLVAIDGLAEALLPFLDSSYLFGLWSADIRNAILWFRNEGEETHPPLDEGYAPSWSWTSGNFPISWTHRIHKSFSDNNSAETLGALILETSTNPTEIYQTAGGFIRLEAMTRALNDLRALDYSEDSYEKPQPWEMILIFDSPNHPLLERENKKDNSKAFITAGEISRSRYSFEALGEFKICRLSSCNDLTSCQTSTISHELILQSTRRIHHGIPEYKRIGLAQEIPLKWIEQGTRQEIILV